MNNVSEVCDLTEVCDFTDNTYSAGFLSVLHDLQRSNDFTDVVLCSGDAQFSCHRVVLSAASPYFRAMFASGLQESQSGEVNLKDIDPKTLEAIVSYIYNAKVQITTSNVQQIIQACETLQLESLKSACEDFVIRHTDPSNCIGLYQFAHLFRLKKLRKNARKDMLKSFREVTIGQEFLELSTSDLIEYIRDDQLHVHTEDPVFEAVVKWTKHDTESRSSEVDKVMEHVRLPHCTSVYLCSVVKDCALMKSEACQVLLEEARMFHMLPDRRSEMHSSRTMPRAGFNMERHLVLVGGIGAQNKDSRCCWFLVEDKSSWELLAQLPMKYKFYSVCSLHTGIVITGGHHGNNKRECWLFDMQEKRWKVLPALLEGRCKHASVVHAGCVYVLGGEDERDKPMKSVEVLDMRTRQWRAAAPMPKALAESLVVSQGRFIYVFSGIDENGGTSTTTLRFDPVWGEWTALTDMPQKCRLGCVATIHDLIYVVGGYTRTALCYEPATNSWLKMANAPQEKHGNAAAVVWQGKLLLAGGDLDNVLATTLVEAYDPDTATWSCWPVPLREELSCHTLLNVDLCGI